MTVKSSVPSPKFASELTPEALREQSDYYRGSGGASEGNRSLGFRPAFYDMDTGQAFPSRFANGLEAPMHVLDGLPDGLVVARQENGRVTAVKPGVIAGFVRHGHFFTREQAALATTRMKAENQRLSNPEHQKEMWGAWEKFVLNPGYSSELVRPVIGESWRRCVEEVDPNLQRAPAISDSQELEQRRHRESELRAAAKPVLLRAGDLLSQSGIAVLLADSEGLVLDANGDPRTRNQARNVNLSEGGFWDEQSVGTNGIGTALAAAEPVQLFGAEHFCAGIKPFTCSADVIRDPHSGRVLGALDLSGPTSSYRPNALDFAMTAARLIEANLARAYFKCREEVLEGSRRQFHDWRSDGLMAFDRRGRLVKANRLAFRALEERGVDLALTPQTRLAALDLEQTPDPAAIPAWLRRLPQRPIQLRQQVVGTLVVIPSHH